MSMVMGSKQPKMRRQTALSRLSDKWQSYCQERKCGAESLNGGQTTKTEG
jgi:hypothetical protein